MKKQTEEEFDYFKKLEKIHTWLRGLHRVDAELRKTGLFKLVQAKCRRIL